MKRKQQSMNKLRTLHMHNHMKIWYKQVDKEIPRYNLRKLTFRALALRQSEKTFVIINKAVQSTLHANKWQMAPNSSSLIYFAARLIN